MIVDSITLYTMLVVATLATSVMGWLYIKAKEKAKAADDMYGHLLHLKKSSETRIGLVGEQLSPYLENWPFDDPREFRLISSPIDGINFGKDEITIVEIKTGKARLSKSQKRVRELVRQGKVSYIEFRVGTGGCEVRKTEREK